MLRKDHFWGKEAAVRKSKEGETYNVAWVLYHEAHQRRFLSKTDAVALRCPVCLKSVRS
jgi:hypothetical protein